MRTTLGLVVLASLLGQTTSAPAPIHTVYDESIKSTEIKTNWLYVLNAPDQFLQLKFEARFEGKKMPKTGPGVFEVQVISQAPENRYVGLPELIAIADGVEIKIGKMDQHPVQALMGMFKGGQKGAESLVNNTLSPIPPTAAVLVQHKSKDLVGEWIVTTISWQQLTTLAGASKIDWKLGATTFSFNEIQLTRVKQFVAAVTPEGGVVTTASVPEDRSDRPLRTDTPSDANNSTLKDTLDWLKQQIAKFAADVPPTGTPQTLSLTKFDRCTIEWQLAPALDSTSRSYKPPIMDYEVNLKDLEPESVVVRKSDDKFWLEFSTRNRAQLIKLRYRDNRAGSGPYSEPRPLNSASFALKKNDLGGEMREALSHAIKLCAAGSTK